MLAKSELDGVADFKAGNNVFTLQTVPLDCQAPAGVYNLDWRTADSQDQHFFSESSALADWLIYKSITRPTEELVHIELDYKAYPFKVSALEPYLGQSGWAVAEKVTVTSVEDEEFLVLTAITDDGLVLDGDLSQRLMAIHCSSVSNAINEDLPELLGKTVAIEREQVAQSLDYRNAQYFDEETVKLDRWSDDLKFGLETEIKQIDKDIKETKKQAAASSTLAEKLGEQKKLRALEGVRNAKRRSLYEAQDKIDADRDVLIKKVEKQLKCSTKNERLFVVRWTLN